MYPCLQHRAGRCRALAAILICAPILFSCSNAPTRRLSRSIAIDEASEYVIGPGTS